MTDRERVIYNIERCICRVPDACQDCSKYKCAFAPDCMELLMADALGLLKEQEPIVKCKNCKFRHDPIRCRLDSEGLKTPDDWFCADGERQ